MARGQRRFIHDSPLRKRDSNRRYRREGEAVLTRAIWLFFARIYKEVRSFASGPAPPACRFAHDSPLEGDGFEPSVPRQIRSRFRDSQPRIHHGFDGLANRNRKFESISLQRRVLCEPDFLNRGAENIAERWPTLACKANIARARELIAASVAVTDPPAEHDDPDLDVSAVEILPGARHRCEALTAPDGRPGRIHRAVRGLGLKARDGAAARLRE